MWKVTEESGSFILALVAVLNSMMEEEELEIVHTKCKCIAVKFSYYVGHFYSVSVHLSDLLPNVTRSECHFLDSKSKQ